MEITYVIQVKIIGGEDYKQAEMACGVNTMEIPSLLSHFGGARLHEADTPALRSN
jgi:hypothetical protein